MGSGLGGDRRSPGVPGEQAAEHVEGPVAVLAGGVDVAADVEPVLGGVFAGEPPEIFCWVLVGRTPRSLMLFVGQIRVSVANRSTSSSRSRQNSSRSRPGCWAVEFLGPGMRGTADRPTATARRNSVTSGAAVSPGIAARPLSRAWFQAWIRPRSARCAWAGQCASG